MGGTVPPDQRARRRAGRYAGGAHRRNDRRRGDDVARAATDQTGRYRLVGAPLTRAAYQDGSRVSPQRLGKRVAKIAPREADIGEHAVVEAGEHGRIVPVFERAREPLDAADHDS